MRSLVLLRRRQAGWLRQPVSGQSMPYAAWATQLFSGANFLKLIVCVRQDAAEGCEKAKHGVYADL